MMWLFEARKRYGLAVLNYMVTSNHVHLLVYSGADRSVIPRSVQLMGGRVAQEFNRRKGRGGAFWEDRYHATAVQTGEHLRRCMVYMDMNMVRAGAVEHPGQWECCGYREIQNPPCRYARIDRALLARLLELQSADRVADWQRRVAEECVPKYGAQKRDPAWTESVAVGEEAFVTDVAERLGLRGRYRTIQSTVDGASVLRESSTSYRTNFDPENGGLRPHTGLS